MPNTGKPSKDCHLCRARRVKVSGHACNMLHKLTLPTYVQCDLARPACQRCIRYGAQCPGYRDQQDLVFRHANPSTIKKRKKRAEKVKDAFPSPASTAGVSASSASNRSTPSLSDTELASRTAISYSDPHLPLNKPVSEHWTEHSVPIVLNVYSTLQFLGEMYRNCPPDGPLVWAAHLFARTYVTNIRYPTSITNESRAETQRELGTYLGKTLNAVSSALQSREGALRDDTLATVWVLSNYEVNDGALSTCPGDLLADYFTASCGIFRPWTDWSGIEPLAPPRSRLIQHPPDPRPRLHSY